MCLNLQKPSGSCDYNSLLEAAKVSLTGATKAVQEEVVAIFEVRGSRAGATLVCTVDPVVCRILSFP